MSSSISHSRLLHMPDLAWGSLASGCEQAAFQSRRASPINEHGVGTFEHGRVEPPKLFAMSAARGQVCERRVMKLQNLGGRRTFCGGAVDALSDGEEQSGASLRCRRPRRPRVPQKKKIVAHDRPERLPFRLGLDFRSTIADPLYQSYRLLYGARSFLPCVFFAAVKMT